MPHMDTVHCQARLTRSQTHLQQELSKNHACHDYTSVTNELCSVFPVSQVTHLSFHPGVLPSQAAGLTQHPAGADTQGPCW